MMVVDGVVRAEYDRIYTPTFNPDGSLEYLAVKDNSLYRVQHLP